MKIYHKRNFAEGIFMLGLGALNLLMGFIRQDITAKDGFLCAALFLFAGALLVRSLSREASRQDRIEAMDERNQLVKLNAESRALAVSQSVSFVLIVGCLIAYAVTGSRDFIGIFVGLGIAWGISMLAEVAAFFYYDSKL